jgi:AmmeMemoRadiSam system protein B/AmmeMemoRadiSam system protein A
MLHADPMPRPAAVAGLFYAASPATLAHDVDAALVQARQVSPAPPKALIVPHAGYVYSGAIAAAGYASLRAAASTIRRVVVAGPCHRVPIDGLAVPTVDAFQTPLGRVLVDRDAIAVIERLPHVVRSDAAHAHEHAIEVQLPFLQRVLTSFAIVPIAVGDAQPEDVARVLERLWGGPETLILVSSDLSHYHPYAEARERDAATLRRILDLDPRLGHGQACGATPLGGLLIVAASRGLVPTLLDARNSGDTAGDKSRVVGYATVAFHETGSATDADRSSAIAHEERGDTLLRLARTAIDSALGGQPSGEPRAAWLDTPAACFVTLRQQGSLRGCVGSIDAVRPLRDDVRVNARAAALRDPRFPPLARDELARTRIEVSLLERPSAIDFEDRDHLLAQLRPGLDGIVLHAGVRRATFLPQVWESIDDRGAFVDALMAKAGLTAGTPVTQCRFARYRVRKWCEQE